MGNSICTLEKRGKTTLPHFNDLNQLICRKCEIYQDINEFYQDLGCVLRNNKGTECKTCQAKRKQIYRRNTIKNDIDLHLKSILRGCKTRIQGLTKKGNYRNLEYNLDITYIKELYNNQKGICKISGIEMTYTTGSGRHKTNISIDRIDSNIGYIKGNIQLVCSHINMMKSNLNLKELIKFCKHIVIYNENKN